MFPSLVIHLEERSLRYGHHPHNSNYFPISYPRRALHLVWADENKFEKVVNWNKVDGLVPIVQAVAGVKIWVDDVALLTSDRHCAKYGRLHTGDIITLFEPGKSRTYLRFRCEVFLIVSRYGRGKRHLRLNISLLMVLPVFRRIIITFSSKFPGAWVLFLVTCSDFLPVLLSVLVPMLVSSQCLS